MVTHSAKLAYLDQDERNAFITLLAKSGVKPGEIETIISLPPRLV